MLSAVDWMNTEKDEAARILIASDRLKWDTRSAIRCLCTTNDHTDKSYVIGRWGEWGNSEPLKKSK